MELSRQQWLVAVTVAVTTHLLVGLALGLAGMPSQAPADTPRGIMVSLNAFDTGPPPAATSPSAPLEAPEPADAVPQSPAPAATPSTMPESAADIGPQPDADTTPQVASPETPSTQAPNAPSPALPEAQAVQVHTNDTASAIGPREQVTARPATPESSATSNQPDAWANGAYGDSERSTEDYIVRLRAWLSRHKRYPQQARREAVAGTVRLYLVINQDGDIVRHRIAQTSGSAVLDKAAERMLQRAEPLPPMPAAMRRNRLELVIPIVFSLQ